MKILYPISAQNVKKGLKAYGIKVFRCSQNSTKGSALITIESSIENQKKTIKFFKEFNLCLVAGIKYDNVRNTSRERLDLGNVYCLTNG